MDALPEVNHSDALPEVNHSDIPLENRTDLQNKNLDLDSIGKLVVADGSMATYASNASEDKPSTQTARQNATQAMIREQAENLPIFESPVTNILVISSKETVDEVTIDPSASSIPENAQQLNTTLVSDTPPAVKASHQIDVSLDVYVPVQPPCEPVAPNLSKTVIVDVSQLIDGSTRIEGDCADKSSSSHNSPILLLDFAAPSSATQKSALNPNAVEFLLATTPNTGVSPVASAPSPVAPNMSNDNLLNYTSTSLSAPELLEHRTFLEKL